MTLHLKLNLETLQFDLGVDDNIPIHIKSRRIEQQALGLVWVIEQVDPDERATNAEIEMFNLTFSQGETGFSLNKSKARMEVRFADLSSDGRGVVFNVSDFRRLAVPDWI